MKPLVAFFFLHIEAHGTDLETGRSVTRLAGWKVGRYLFKSMGRREREVYRVGSPIPAEDLGPITTESVQVDSSY